MEIGPLIEVGSTKHDVPLVALLALGQAESNWTRDDPRRGVWPDWSDSYGQISVSLSAYYGIGDGTPASADLVHDALMDRERSIDIMADYYRKCLDAVEAGHPELAGDDLLLQGMIKYNSGGYQEPGNWYWTDPKWAGNPRRYQTCLVWAHALLEGGDA